MYAITLCIQTIVVMANTMVAKTLDYVDFKTFLNIHAKSKMRCAISKEKM